MRTIRHWWNRLWRRWPESQFVKVPELTNAEKRQVMRSLARHPGFQWLMAELENQKAAIERRVARRDHAAATVLDPRGGGLDGTIRYTIQAAVDEEAIFRLGYLQNLVNRAEAKPDIQPAPARTSRPTSREPQPV